MALYSKNAGVGSQPVLQGIFLTQGSNPHCRQILYCLSQDSSKDISPGWGGCSLPLESSACPVRLAGLRRTPVRGTQLSQQFGWPMCLCLPGPSLAPLSLTLEPELVTSTVKPKALPICPFFPRPGLHPYLGPLLPSPPSKQA